MKHSILFFTIVFLLAAAPLAAQEEETLVKDESIAETIASHVDNMINRILRRHFPASDSSATADTTDLEENDEIFTDAQKIEITGDTTIAEGQIIDGNLIVKNGTLKVAGTIRGNATVRNGDLVLLPAGTIEGNALVVNGKIKKEQGGKILGYEETSSSYRVVSQRIAGKRLFHSSTSFDVPWEYEVTDFDQFIFRYNRVESVFLGVGSDKIYYWDGSKQWNAYGFFGWGFKSHKWRVQLGLDRQFQYHTDAHDAIIDVGVEGYILTDTKDRWLLSPLENTLSALLLHEDFRDYYERKGYTLYAGHYTNAAEMKTEVKLGYKADAYKTMENRVDWAFFGGKKTFRPNPPINEGTIRSVFVLGGLTTVEKTSNGPHGWNLFASTEFARRSFGSEFGFDQYTLDVRRFQPLDSYQNINVRFRAGTVDGNAPVQKIFELGGLGTMNAFPYKAFAGNRMLLLNTEFILSGALLDELDFFPSWLFRHVIFIALSDAGWVDTVPSNNSPVEGFGTFSFKNVKHNLGLALGNRAGSFRIGVAWRTDVKAPAHLLLRIERPF